MSDYSDLRNHKFIIILIDLLCIVASYTGAFYIRYNGFPQKNWDSFVALLPWILLIGLFFISIYELYALDRKNSLTEITTKTLVAVIFMACLTMSASFLFREFALPRTVILIAHLFLILIMVFYKMMYLHFTKGNIVGCVLLIGDEENIDKLKGKIKHPLLKDTTITHIKSDVPIKKIDSYIQQVDYVVLCPEISKEKKSKIIYHSMEYNKHVYVIPSLYELLLQRSHATPLDDTLVMSIKPFGLSWDQVFIKRSFDVIFSILLLIVLAPLLFLVSLIIKLEDPKGTIIYKQKRLGKHDYPFVIYKFRSMVQGAESKTGPILASENDSRITRVGKFLRSARIDELPQLFNVLKGDMSLVGPRPEREFFIKKLRKKHYHYSYRNTVKPGITGYAQIMGKYSTEADDKLRFDLFYIRNYSFWLDITILLKTLIVLTDKSKAEGAVSYKKNKKRYTEKSHSRSREKYQLARK